MDSSVKELGINTIEPIVLPAPTYLDDQGVEQKITLEIRPSEGLDYAFENCTNTIRTFFKQNLCSYSPIKVEVKDTFFEWTPFGAGFQDELGSEMWLGRIGNSTAECGGDNRVVYKHAVLDMDEEFYVECGKLKHNTVLNSLPPYDHSLPGNEVNFFVEGKLDFAHEVSMYVNEVMREGDFDTTEEIHFRNTSGEVVFSLPSPVTYEVNGANQIQCSYVISRLEADLISLKIVVPYSWLQEGNRTYPIAIDPTLVTVGNAPNMPSRPRGITFSSTGRYVAFPTLNNNQAFIYEINSLTNTIKELNRPINGYKNSEMCAVFSPDEKYFLAGGSPPLSVYRYDPLSGGFTSQVLQPHTTPFQYVIRNITFSNNGQYVAVSHYYYYRTYKFDKETGLLKNEATFGIPYMISKSEFGKDDALLLTLQEDGKIRTYRFNDGVITGEFQVMSDTKTKIVDFNLSPDGNFIAIALDAAPWINIYKFNAVLGIHGSPTIPNIPPDAKAKKIRFSKTMRYIAVAQYDITKKPRLIFYKFNPSTGELGSKLDVSSNQLPSPDVVSAEQIAIEFSSDGSYLGYAQDSNQASSIFLYRFLDPSDNIFFKDKLTDNYYSDTTGNTLMLLDFGQLIAGQTSLPKEVVIENTHSVSVRHLEVELINTNTDFVIEMSKSDNPFIAEPNLYYSGTINSMDTVPIFFRAVTTEKSTKGGMFEVRAKCRKV
ncbi:WD40 repeat domain-containing protein [Paenibacillus lutrae]|uniref:Uncharacterized protein n=1 Tax=Paenibacillus lutrae TaxID=2078573 RepID=A0A7X3FJ98_9BACL|nr:WD40 repeat domain-containing protein [Paenibacillus lutrae]MVP00794.1 hypothetical protein [Paenibacillus lutrae]